MGEDMTLQLYAHPFSSYCQKVLIALYENRTPFTFCMLAPGEDQTLAEFARLSPMQRMPVLVDGDRALFESSVIVEYLGLYRPGPVQLIPADAKAALEVRLMDRIFDNYIMGQMQKFVFDSIRPAQVRDAHGVAQARGMLDTAYGWLDGVMAKRLWAAGETFSLADCAAAPSLFYADWVHPIGEKFANLRDYRRRLLARPSFARAVDEGRPYRSLFPPGAPDRD
jgi:glutathione S-transferase